MIKQIDYYGTDDNYIHLKFGDARKMYNFTSNFREQYPIFTKEYIKYWNDDKTCQFKNPFQIVGYAYREGIPVHFYYNFTDTPAKNEEEIMEYLARELSYIGDLK
jgi:hypothetical protein